MKCENELCIYQRDEQCFLDNISINEWGQCTQCITANLPEEWLEKAKKETLLFLSTTEK